MSDYDVFISYSWTDNITVECWPAVNEDRWIGCFKAALQERLDYKLKQGNQPTAKIFLDSRNMSAGDHLDTEILAALDRTHVFLPLISSAYSTSAYCRLEREHFMGRLGSTVAVQGRIVGVIQHATNGIEDWKKHFFPEVLAFPFYEKANNSDAMLRLGDSGIDKSFLARIDTLADNLLQRIITLRGAAPAVAAPTFGKGQVFFAAVPGHLEQQRTELVTILNAAGWAVFPQENECPADIPECEKWVTDAITNQKLRAYVQIVDSHPWKPGLHDAAQLRGAGKVQNLEQMVYRLAGFELSQVTHKEHHDWLETLPCKTVPQLRVDLPAALEQMLVRQREIDRSNAKLNDAPPAAVYITISVADADEPVAGFQTIAQLQDLEAYASIGSKAGEGLEESFDEINGLLTIYGNEDYSTRLSAVLKSWRIILSKRGLRRTQAPPFGILILPPPPGDKEYCVKKTVVPRMHCIPWGDAAAMAAYLDDVRRFVDAKQNIPAPQGSAA